MVREPRGRILAAAEARFASAGFHGVSLQRVAEDAGVNTSALRYHFATVEALVEAVVSRHMNVIAKRRRAMLEERAASGVLGAREILEIVVLPLAEVAEGHGHDGRAFLKVFARLLSERSETARDLSLEHFGELSDELGERLECALPDVSAELLSRRIGVCAKMAIAMLADDRPFSVAGDFVDDPRTPREVALELIDFFEAGIAAPAGPREANAA